jgi:hypothetical protein
LLARDIFGLVLELCSLGNAKDYIRAKSASITSLLKKEWLTQVS